MESEAYTKFTLGTNQNNGKCVLMLHCVSPNAWEFPQCNTHWNGGFSNVSMYWSAAFLRQFRSFC